MLSVEGIISEGYTPTQDAFYSVSFLAMKNSMRFFHSSHSVSCALGLLLASLLGITAFGQVPSPPVLSVQSSIQTMTVGGSGTIAISVTGSPAPSVQWQVSEDNGSTWSDLSANANYADVTLNVLRLAAIPQWLNGTQYRCVATSSAGTATSTPVTLAVTNATVTTLAGTKTPGSTDGLGWAHAQEIPNFNDPRSVAIDGFGNVYVADAGNNRIRKVSPTGEVTTFAGSGLQTFADGMGTAAGFSFPTGVASDASGNIYVADSGNNKIRKITQSGEVTTLAGSGSQGSTDGPGASASFYWPYGLAVDGSGNVYVADTFNHRIRMVSPNGVVTTLAGSGSQGSVDGTGTAASFNQPYSLAVDGSGNVFVADTFNNSVRKVTAGGVVTTLAGGSTTSGFADGIGTAAEFYYPTGVAADHAGNVFVADYGNDRIRRIDPNGVVTTWAGSNTVGSLDGVGALARFWGPEGLVIDSTGNLFVAEALGEEIRAISPSGVVTTLAGTGAIGSTDGQASGSLGSFSGPAGLAVIASGRIYVADSGNNKIRSMSPSGVVTTIAGSEIAGSLDGSGSAASFNRPNDVAVDASGVIYVADTDNNLIRKITPDGIVTTLAGNANGGFVDGTGTRATFSRPANLTVDPAGNVFVADCGNYAIRRITPSGVVTTLAGSGYQGSVDGTGSAASFGTLGGLAVDATGHLYVADITSNSIRKIDPTGVVTTLAGSGVAGGTDGVGTAASFSYPMGVVLDASGNVYVADSNNYEVRKISPSGVVTTIAGDGRGSYYQGNSEDGVGLTAIFGAPCALALDPSGTIYVADAGLNQIRKINVPDRVAPVITWGTPSAIVYGTPLSSTQLNAAADIPGTFAYTPLAGTVLIPGMQSLSATFTPYDIADYTQTTAAQTLAVKVLAPTPGPSGSVVASGFDLGWAAVAGATGYQLDVSTNSSFSSFVTGYQSLDVGNVTSASLSGLSPNTTYYYRIRAYNAAGTSASSSTATVTTTPTILIAAPLTVSTLAGQPLTSGNADGTSTVARFDYPSGIAADSAGNVYVADTDNDTIRKIVASTGVVTTLAGQAGITGNVDGTGSASTFNRPSGVAVDSAGNIYVADTLNNTLRRVTASGVVSTLAGQAGVSGSANGTGTAAQFFGPQGVAIDGAGNLYVADTNNDTIREIALATGNVTTLAGSAGTAGSLDGAGTAAQFNSPFGVAIDSAGNIYVADAANNTIREISPSGLVSTIAGLAGYSGGADGTGSSARFNSPSDLAVDASGNVYVADTDNFTIRKVVPASGAVSTLAGVAGTSGSADGLGSAARFFHPGGIAADSSSNLYIADTDNHTIRLGLLAAGPTISQQPQSQTVTAGGSVQFSVTASGRPSVTFQWYFGGTAIAGATSSSYSISNAQPSNAGSYTVTVTNVMGSVTSNQANLTVNAVTPPPSGGGGSSGGGGGGGAPSTWFCGALLLIVAIRIFQRRRTEPKLSLVGQ